MTLKTAGRESHALRIGISGGTFDPIHYGHLAVAECARQQLDLSEVIFIPAGRPPHKDNSEISLPKHRLDMVKMAVASNPRFEASGMEIDREGVTYTIDTLVELKRIYGKSSELYFITGTDILLQIDSWCEPERIFKMCEFAIAPRLGISEDEFRALTKNIRNKYDAHIHTLKTPLIGISSTLVRNYASHGKSIKYLVPESVENYIMDNGLYK